MAELIICPGCGIQPVGHVDECPEKVQGAPRPWIRSVIASNHAREGIHVTDLTSCPRAKAFASDPLAPLDWTRCEAAAFGTAVHAWMLGDERYGRERYELRVALRLADTTIVGSADYVVEGTGLLMDVNDIKCTSGQNAKRYKFTSSGRVKQRDPDHEWQVNMYGMALKQAGFDLHQWTIWYGAHTTSRDRKWCYDEGYLSMDEDQLLDYRSRGSSWRARDILPLVKQVTEGKPGRELPMVGATQRFTPTTTACNYCPYALHCERVGGDDVI